MSFTHKFAAASIALASLAAPVFAQDASTGTVVTQQPAGPTFYEHATFGDWTVQCVEVEEGKAKPCSMIQFLKDSEGNAIAEVTVVHLPQDPVDAIMTITTPLRTNLQANLSVVLSEEVTKAYPYSFCTEKGCVVRAALLKEEVETLKTRGLAQVGVTPLALGDQVLLLNMPLTGFADAYEEVTEFNLAELEEVQAAQ